MSTRTLVLLSAGLEVTTGVAFIAAPGFVVHLLLGASEGLSGAGIAVARLAGLALLCLGLACWPNKDDATTQATLTLCIYNLFVAIYLVCIRLEEGFARYLLWPVIALHALLGLLQTRPAYRRVRETTLSASAN